MSRTADLIGQRFGRLLVEDVVGPYPDRQYRLRCICDCGTEKVVRAGDLRAGKTKSCGCYGKDMAHTRQSRLSFPAGHRFGLLTVLGTAGVRETKSGKQQYLNLVCDCGTETTKRVSELQSGSIVSCGCQKRKMLVAGNRKHGMNGTPEYQAWINMRRRCFDPRQRSYQLYGGRGITVCEKWRDSFADFLFDVGCRPGDDYSLDRIDVNGNYEPGNVRWATATEQCNNRRSNHRLTYKGVTQSLADWCRSLKLNPSRVGKNLKRGLTVYESLFLGYPRTKARREKLGWVTKTNRAPFHS